jgi:hypothetical protein
LGRHAFAAQPGPTLRHKMLGRFRPLARGRFVVPHGGS